MKESSETKYPSDVTDSQWEVIQGHFKMGNKSKWSKRELINAVLYREKTGCQWRFLPKDFPPFSTVHSFYRRARLDGTWSRINDALVKITRENAGRKATPSYAIIDSQSVKTTAANDERGFDGGKKQKVGKDTLL